MKKLGLGNFVNVFRKTVYDHGPEILTTVGISGMFATTILAVRVTPKAIAKLEEHKRLRRLDADVQGIPMEPISKKEIIQLTWKCYIPAAVTATLSTACLISATRISARRNAALATVCALSETALREYQDKVVEIVGAEKEKIVRDEIAKDRMEQDPVRNSEVIITEKGNTLCYDEISGRYFRGDMEKFKKVENEINRRLRDEMSISLNDLYYELGLRSIEIGDSLGWSIEHGYLEFIFSSQLADDGTPCLVIGYRTMPRYNGY